MPASTDASGFSFEAQSEGLGSEERPDQDSRPHGPDELTREQMMLAFVERYRADEEAGGVKPVADYLAGLTGEQQQNLARQYLRLKDDQQTIDDGVDSDDHDGFLGPYRLIARVGRGGWSDVYEAVHVTLGHRVALKVLRGWGGADHQLLARFRREAEIMARIDDPGICRVFDSDLEGGTAWIAMQFVEGEILRLYLGRPSPKPTKSPLLD